MEPTVTTSGISHQPLGLWGVGDPPTHSPSPFQYSLCNEPLIELSNPGASGSLFYVTSDDEFIIKTVMHKEAEFLQKLLPGYYMVGSLATPGRRPSSAEELRASALWELPFLGTTPSRNYPSRQALTGRPGSPSLTRRTPSRGEQE